jgi:hypothetical protein
MIPGTHRTEEMAGEERSERKITSPIPTTPAQSRLIPNHFPPKQAGELSRD